MASRSARSLAWWLGLCALCGSVQAAVVELRVSGGGAGSAIAGLERDDGVIDVVARAQVQGGMCHLTVPDRLSRPGLWVARVRLEDGRLARKTLGASPDTFPEGLTVEDADLFVPARIVVQARADNAEGVTSICLFVTETDGHTLARVARVSGGQARFELEDVFPGAVSYSALSDRGDSGSVVDQARPGEGSTVSVLLTAPKRPTVNVAPYLYSGGDLAEGMHRAATLAVFGLVLAVWLLLACCYSPVWSFFGLRDRRARIVLNLATAVVGILLVGNGVALLLLGTVQYVPLVTAVCALQLVFLVLALPAHLSRKTWARSLATLGVVFGLLVTFVFLPSFVFEGEDAAIGRWLTLTQLVLVCGMAGALTWLGLVGRRASAEADRAVCPVCESPFDPLSGRCRCEPRELGGGGLKLARLSLLRLDGRRSEFAIGPHTRIGSEPSADIALPEDPAIAPAHAVIELEFGDLQVRDLGAPAGVFVNGERVSVRRLRTGDEILLGDTWLVVELL